MLSRDAGVFVNPIRTSGADYVHHITTGSTRVLGHDASLLSSYNEAVIEDWGNPTPTSTVTVNDRGVVPGSAEGAMAAPPDFGRSVKPYLNQEGQLMPTTSPYFQTFLRP